jgi:hypothetical protein
MKVKIGEYFLTWYKMTNAHLYDRKTKASRRNKELEEYVNDVLLEHLESMQELLSSDGDEDDAPDSGFTE